MKKDRDCRQVMPFSMKEFRLFKQLLFILFLICKTQIRSMIKTAYLSIRRSYFKENFIDPWTSFWFNVLFFKVLWVAFIIRLYLFNVHFPNIGGTVFISLYSLEMFESIVLKRVKQFKIQSFIEKINVSIKN